MADSREERIQALESALGNVSPQNGAGGESGGEVDYYKNLKNESYRAMLDSEIQANVAKEQALKYVGTGLNATGLAGQGMAESTRLGILNTYQNAMNNAQETYTENLANINMQEAQAQQAKTADNFESLTALMSNAYDKDTLNGILGQYNISVSSNGTLSGAGYDSLDENSRKQLSALYQLYSSSYGEPGVYSDAASLGSVNIIGSDGKAKSLGAQFGEEIDIAFVHAQQGDLQPGDVICMDNTYAKTGSKGYIMWTGNGFKVVSESDYNNAAKGYIVKASKGDTTWSAK